MTDLGDPTDRERGWREQADRGAHEQLRERARDESRRGEEHAIAGHDREHHAPLAEPVRCEADDDLADDDSRVLRREDIPDPLVADAGDARAPHGQQWHDDAKPKVVGPGRGEFSTSSHDGSRDKREMARTHHTPRRPGARSINAARAAGGLVTGSACWVLIQSL